MHRQLTILLTAVLVLAGTACTIADSGTRSSRSASTSAATTGYLPQQVRDRLYSQQIELRVDDVLTRRTRLYLEAGDRGLVASEHAARLMGDVLGWDDEKRAAEVARYRRRVEAELAAQAAPDDDAAAAIRERVRDPRVPG
jgi:glycerol-3-phosphate dehydrogenase